MSQLSAAVAVLHGMRFDILRLRDGQRHLFMREVPSSNRLGQMKALARITGYRP